MAAKKRKKDSSGGGKAKKKAKALLLYYTPEPRHLSDVEIHSADGGVLSLHIVSLMMHSKVFAAAYEYHDPVSSDKGIEPITIDCDFATLKAFFSSFGYYPNYTQLITEANALPMARLAHKYDVAHVLEACEEVLVNMTGKLSLITANTKFSSSSSATTSTEEPAASTKHTPPSLIELIAFSRKVESLRLYENANAEAAKEDISNLPLTLADTASSSSSSSSSSSPTPNAESNPRSLLDLVIFAQSVSSTELYQKTILEMAECFSEHEPGEGEEGREFDARREQCLAGLDAATINAVLKAAMDMTKTTMQTTKSRMEVAQNAMKAEWHETKAQMEAEWNTTKAKMKKTIAHERRNWCALLHVNDRVDATMSHSSQFWRKARVLEAGKDITVAYDGFSSAYMNETIKISSPDIVSRLAPLGSHTQ